MYCTNLSYPTPTSSTTPPNSSLNIIPLAIAIVEDPTNGHTHKGSSDNTNAEAIYLRDVHPAGQCHSTPSMTVRDAEYHGFPIDFTDNNRILPLLWNGPIGYEEAMGGLEEKITIVEGKDRITGKVSHARSRSEFSQEEDQAQEHAVGYHTGGCAHDHMEPVTREAAWTEAGQ
ncbi:uncharacterized protein UBRO_20207 [Ustilago bromivora]|uniref:Uncharacterized protein n=1 Tax=Ustilago bromivora TaxID=307758 RepID=A0A1K0GTK9_9BASI|nr:uncharacterized protein UBRO_20207 [Ustilago bromivora]